MSLSNSYLIDAAQAKELGIDMPDPDEDPLDAFMAGEVAHTAHTAHTLHTAHTAPSPQCISVIDHISHQVKKAHAKDLEETAKKQEEDDKMIAEAPDAMRM